MKKLFIGALMAATFYGYGQNYFSVSAGYALGIPGLSGTEYDLDMNDQGSYKVKNLNMGGGINASIAYGVFLAENLHLDLAIGYQNNLGSSTESSEYFFGIQPVRYVETNTVKTNSFRFAPSLRFAAGDGSIKPYAKVGPQVILASMTMESEMEAGAQSVLTEEKYSANISVGATAAIGVEFEINEGMMFFVSVDANLGFYSPSSSEVVTYEENGMDMLDQLTKADKEWEYEKELSADDWNGGSPDQPSKDFRRRYDYSSIGLNVGVRILL